MINVSIISAIHPLAPSSDVKDANLATLLEAFERTRGFSERTLTGFVALQAHTPTPPLGPMASIY